MSDAAISLFGFFAFGGPYAYLMARMLRELGELETNARRNFPRTVHRPVDRPSRQERLPLFGYWSGFDIRYPSIPRARERMSNPKLH